MLGHRLAVIGISIIPFAGCSGDSAVMGERAPLMAAAGRSSTPTSGAAGADTSGGGGGASADAESSVPSGPRPDLVLDATYLVDTTAQDFVETNDACLIDEGCVRGLGQRRVVRFGSRTGNTGTADLRLGRAEAGNPYWTYDACHESYDLVGFGAYELFDANTGALVLTGAKNGFCIRGSEPWALEGGPSCKSYDCNEQGIGQGCADNYGSELQCQWIDITDLPAGAYMLRVTINASRAIAELDYANNTVDINLEVSDDAVSVLR